MDKFFYLIIEGVKNTLRHKITAFTAIFSLFISLYIIGLIIIAGENTHKVLQYLRTKYKIEAFFDEKISNEEAIGLIHRIKRIKGVKNATIIEKEDAVRIFKDQFGENIIDLLGYNPLPVSTVINLDRNIIGSINIDPIIKEIRAIKQIDEIKYQGNLIRKIERNFKKIVKYIPYFSGSIIIIIGLIIYSLIKISIYSRKETIKSLELIGATRMFIKLPFIIEGAFISLISIALAFPVLFGTVKATNYLISNFTVFKIKVNFDPFIFFWLLILVLVISILASFRATSSFLK